MRLNVTLSANDCIGDSPQYGARFNKVAQMESTVAETSLAVRMRPPEQTVKGVFLTLTQGKMN